MKQRLRDLEASDNWIAARVDELMDDELWYDLATDDWADSETNKTPLAWALDKANEQATREHAEIEAMILDAQIDNLELK